MIDLAIFWCLFTCSLGRNEWYEFSRGSVSRVWKLWVDENRNWSNNENEQLVTVTIGWKTTRRLSLVSLSLVWIITRRKLWAVKADWLENVFYVRQSHWLEQWCNKIHFKIIILGCWLLGHKRRGEVFTTNSDFFFFK